MKRRGLKKYIILSNTDYDKQVKLQGEKISCYSKDMLDKLYDNEADYKIIGEIVGKNKKTPIGEIDLPPKDGQENSLEITRVGKHSKLLYGVAGYVETGDDVYLALLKFRAGLFWLLTGLLLAIAAVAIILGLGLFGGKKAADNPMPEPDPYVEEINDDTQKTDSNATGGSVSMIYNLKATVSLSKEQVNIYFKNPKASNHDVVLELYTVSGDTKTKIAESGRISSGYGLYKMDLNKDGKSLPSGKFAGEYKVVYYNPETGERALVESEITDVEIDVTK